MKTKQTKEESDKSIEDETTVEPKTRARKKATDLNEDDKNKYNQEESKTSKEPKKNLAKPRAIVKKRPLGIRKTLRSKKSVQVGKDKIKNAIKQKATRGRRAVTIKTEPDNSQKETVPLIPASEIKKEPVDDTTPGSRSSSPRTAGRRQRLSSDMIMMKSVLADPPSSLVLGPRTSPYSMRSERSNSPSLFDGKNLRSGKPRKVKNLLNEVVIKEQKKRRRLLSETKNTDAAEASDDCKKLKRGRSCSRDGSEISKCSDNTESDLSLSETLNDTDSKELNKRIDKPKTDLDIDIENNVQISTIEKVPSHSVDPKLAETKLQTEPSCIVNEKNKNKLSLQRSTSLDSDNNNSNRLKLDNLNSSDIEGKAQKTENDTLFEARSSILTSMSKTFNSKEVSKNMRKARRGRRAAATPRSTPVTPKADLSTITNDAAEDKHETLESLSKEIDDLINNLDENIDRDHEMINDSNIIENTSDQIQTKSVSKFYGLSKPLGDNNSIITPETPVKDKDAHVSMNNESTPSKTDDSENINLHYEEDSLDKSMDSGRPDKTYKCSTVASIDLLMDRLKEFEEFDKRRQRQESETKSSDGKTVMVTSDVVLIPKSGDIKPLKDIHTVRSPERPLEKENVLSCFQNNSAISIVKRDYVRKSIDVEMTNSVTLIKRNSINSRKESTSSNHSKESDAISIFEKSLGKDVTLTEIRKSVDKGTPASQVDLHQFATLHTNNQSQALVGVILDTNQISITPRVVGDSKSEVQITKLGSRESVSRKFSESAIEPEDKMATIEMVKSPTYQMRSSEISITPTPVAIKSPEAQPVEAEAAAPSAEITKVDLACAELPILPAASLPSKDMTEVPVQRDTPDTEATKTETVDTEATKNEKIDVPKSESAESTDTETKTDIASPTNVKDAPAEMRDAPEKMDIEDISEERTKARESTDVASEPSEVAKAVNTEKGGKSARNSVESLPGPSTALHETPESQKRKENVLRTLGLLTHKAAKEAKIEKLKEKERIYGGLMSNKSKAAKSGSGDYTGTLKTVIKLNRSTGERDRKKYRSSLKMTFQKSKHRSGKPPPELGDAPADEAYYTIERREGGAGSSTDGGHRKTYSNRLNSHDPEAVPEPVEPKETLNLVIPEKASSFSIHPGRLCMDQCFYCGGKFGLFDTPCHIAQMKSSERQKKVLDNEEKLTIDSCLCDACYRHVDRRANCPSYRKRPPPKRPPSPPLPAGTDKIASPPPEEDSEGEAAAAAAAAASAAGGAGVAGGSRRARCHTAACAARADHSIRRKWLIKMRPSVNKLLKLEGDYPGLHTIPLCAAHYAALAPLMACALCARRITKHHNVHFIHHGYEELNPLLAGAGLPVRFLSRPVLCKLCRYYCTLLQRPQHNEPHARQYRRKLLQIYNIEVPPESDVEGEAALDDDAKKKKPRTKSKQRKSEDKPDESDKTDSSPEKPKEEAPPLEEDIESLISSNRILVPTAVRDTENTDADVYDFDALVPVDKQTELQYLLQKQNNPAQFLHKPNLTQKHKNITKIQTPTAIQKPGLQQRINDKNAKKLHKLGQIIVSKDRSSSDVEMFDPEKNKEGMPMFKNMSLNDECTIESIPNKKPADINTLKNKWQMSESFTQVKKNLSELSKKLSVEPKKTSEVKYSNPVKRLETNPSISVRELFPGEEEMNLQCNIEFNNVKGVTPEGWEKCNTTIQYDNDTKRLWNELQRPYGNQSSFLRHLILLEKYFRSGDLVLSHNATPHAANYSDSIQSRLRAYDNVVNETPRRAEPAISLIEYRKKPSVNGKSLLKSNQHDGEKDPKKMPPPFPKKKSSDKSKAKAFPPELIAINTPNAQGRKAIQNVLHNIQQLVKGVSASDPTEVAAAPLPPVTPPAVKFESPVGKFDPPGGKFDTSTPTPAATPAPAALAPAPEKEAPKKTKPTSKPWRPTLMPITPENMARIGREPTQVAVDGRLLPSLVQVMSSGTRYHITLQDYNKMCVMRREKLQQLHETRRPEEPVVTDVQTSALLGNGGTVTHHASPEREPDLQISSNAATILKNVGLKNITIAPILAKTATVTSHTMSPAVTSPSYVKLPQLGPAVSITAEAAPPLVAPMVMPKIPKSLTVIPQTVGVPAGAVLVPQLVVPQGVVLAADGQRP